MALHNYVLQHADLKIKQEQGMLNLWNGFFKQISDLISQSKSIKQVSFTFESELVGSDTLVFEEPVFHTAECGPDDIWDDDSFTPALVSSGMSYFEHNLTKFGPEDAELMVYINKVCHSMLPKLIEDLPRLDSDDWIVVTSDSVNAHFRRYEHWDMSTNQVPAFRFY